MATVVESITPPHPESVRGGRAAPHQWFMRP